MERKRLMIEYPKEFLEDLNVALLQYRADYNMSPMPILDVIHNFVNGKYGPVNKNDMYARKGE